MFSGFVLGTICQEFWRGAVIRRKSTGTDLFTATIGLVGRSRRRYGGYIVHVGIVLMCLGFAGQGFKQSSQVLLKPGQQTTLGSYVVRMDALKVTNDNQKQMITGHFTVFEGGREIAKMYPARWFFNKHEEPTTEVAIRRKFEGDLYLNMHNFQVADQTASLEITINPLVNWIWLGFAVMALGTGIVLLPERTFAFAMAKFPAPEVATTAGMLLLMLVSCGACAGAAYRERRPGASRDVLAIRARVAARHHLHVRHLRAEESRGVHLQQGRRDAHGALGSCQEGQDARRGHSVLRRQVRQPGAARVADRQGLQSAGVVLPVRGRRIRRRRRAPSSSESGRGARTTSRRRHRCKTPPSAEDAALQARLDRELENLD